MANTRINQIAKEAKVSNKEVIAKLAELGIEVEDEKAEIDEEDAQLVLDLLKEENGETISIDGPLTVQNLADAVGKSVSEVIMELMKMELSYNKSEVTFEAASLLAQNTDLI
ncbi:MAG: translation initiation factor IF-2 N-terminal domain-containing protein [Intestinibacter sp.]